MVNFNNAGISRTYARLAENLFRTGVRGSNPDSLTTSLTNSLYIKDKERGSIIIACAIPAYEQQSPAIYADSNRFYAH